jgi:hypothetical protein
MEIASQEAHENAELEDVAQMEQMQEMMADNPTTEANIKFVAGEEYGYELEDNDQKLKWLELLEAKQIQQKKKWICSGLWN